MATLLARIRLPVQYAGFLALIGGVVLLIAAAFGAELGSVPVILTAAGVLLILVSSVITIVSPVPTVPVVELRPPVRGRWLAVNSPASKVPSHGTHAYGQTFAVDMAAVPAGAHRPEFGTTDGHFLPPDDFPGFGLPLYAPADAVVVRAWDGARDHRSRSSYPALAYLALESVFRELRGLRGVLGNHLVLRLADGSCFVMAHLKQGSIRVRRGDRVVQGQVVAECGNTGNSTEPHLHCQRQDIANTFVALGLPWTLPGGIPGNEEIREFD